MTKRIPADCERSDSSNVIKIWNFKATLHGDQPEISAEVDGDRVSFRAPSHCNVFCRAEPFLGIALVAAMARNVDIHIDDSMPVSGRSGLSKWPIEVRGADDWDV